MYGPNDYRERIFMARVILSGYCSHSSYVGGDFNITRWVHERFPIGKATTTRVKVDGHITLLAGVYPETLRNNQDNLAGWI